MFISYLKLIFKVLVEIINENPAVITLVLGILAYYLGKETYDNNNAPAIIPVEFDVDNHKIKIVNHGKGVAQNIKLENYNCFMIFPKSSFTLWKLSFKPIGFLAPNGETFAATDENNLFLFANYFSEYSKQKIPLVITYKNLSGKRYITSVIIEKGRFEFVKFGVYPWEKRAI